MFDSPEFKELVDLVIRYNTLSKRRRRNNNDLPVGVQLKNGKFIARISIDGKTKHLGVFDDPIKASLAYKYMVRTQRQGLEKEILEVLKKIDEKYLH